MADLWEILVPTIHSDTGKPIRVRFHRVWDNKVREMSGGLTLSRPVKGQWINPRSEVVAERMIPVRILASRMMIEQIMDFTAKYYKQEAVMCYKISNEVILKVYNG